MGAHSPPKGLIWTKKSGHIGPNPNPAHFWFLTMVYDISLCCKLNQLTPQKVLQSSLILVLNCFIKTVPYSIFGLYINDKIYCSIYHEIWQILSVSKHLRSFGVAIWAHKSLQ